MVREYPWLEEIYREIAMLSQKPEEVLGMFSEALRILDQNTVKYMIEELQKKVEEKDAVINDIIQERNSLINEKDSLINEKDAEIEILKKQIKELSEKDHYPQ